VAGLQLGGTGHGGHFYGVLSRLPFRKPLWISMSELNVHPDTTEKSGSAILERRKKYLE
jgi:hypothetical protein